MKQSEIKIMQHRRYLTLLWKRESEGFDYPIQPPKSYFQAEKVYVNLNDIGLLYSTYTKFFRESKAFTPQEELDYRTRYESTQKGYFYSKFKENLGGVKLRLTNAALHERKNCFVYVLENEKTNDVYLFSGKSFRVKDFNDDDNLFYGPKDSDMTIIG